MRKKCGLRFLNTKKKCVLLIATILALSGCGFEVIGTGSRGVKTRFGEVIGEPLPEGLHFYNPLTSSIYEFEVRQDKWSDKTSIFTKDTQRVDVEFTVVYYPDPAAVTTIYQKVGRERELVDKIIKPIVLGSIKDSIGQVIADELVMKRELVTKEALHKVQANLKEGNVIVQDLQFTNLDFDDAYEKAVEQKVVAIQDAQKAKNKTVQIDEEAKQTVKTATATAEAMRIKSQALSQNKGLIDFEWVQKWDGKLPQTTFGAAVPMINLDSLKR